MKPDRKPTDYVHPIPCDKFLSKNSLPKQMAHILEEFNETWEAINDYTLHTETPERERKEKIAEELTDIITSCRTALSILGLSQVETEAMQVKVNVKNKRRGYWQEA